MNNKDKQLSVLHDLSKAMIGVSSMEEVCEGILARTVSVLKVDKASIMKLDPIDGTLKIVAAKGMPKDIVSSSSVKIGQGISGKVFKSKKPLLLKNIKSSKYQARDRYKSSSLMSAPVTFPMNVGGNPVGVINVTDRRGKKGFTSEDLKLLTTIANQTAAYLHLCDLADDARRNEHLKRELEVAREIQQRLLPRRIPKMEKFDVAGMCLMAQKVGGDYFDFVVKGSGLPSIVVADVAGHSIGAAMMMTSFRSAVRTDISNALSPSIVAEKLNAILYDDLVAAEQFISMVYAQILGDSIIYTTAGHHAPLVYQDGKFINYSTDDDLLGVNKFSEYHEKRIAVKAGNIIVLFTDGLVDAARKSGERYGIERVKDYISKNSDKSSETLTDGLCGEARRFIGRQALKDDVTVVVLKVKE